MNSLRFRSACIGVTLLALTSPLMPPGLSADLQVGTAVVEITPPVGFRKGGGYSEIISTGIHDPLLAKALVLRQGDVTAVLVISDLLSVPEPLSAKARAQASERTGIPASHIVIAATHNHGSPEYWGSLRDVFHETAIRRDGIDRHEPIDYQSHLIEAWVKAIEEGWERLEAVEVELLAARQDGLAFNRRFHMRDGTVRFNPGPRNPDIVRPAGPVDPDLPFLLFRRARPGGAGLQATAPRGAPLAGLTTFAMHTAAFGGTQFGADFPGHLQTRLRESFGKNFVSLFAEGAAGDVNHIDVASDRTPVAADEPPRIAATLARTLTDSLDRARPLKEPCLAVHSTSVLAPIERIDELGYQRARSLLANQATAQTPFLKLVEAWRDCHRYDLGQRYGDHKPLEIQVLRLDRDTAIVTLPHEVFVEIGLGIKAASPFRHTIVISLANDVDFYIPTRRAFVEGSYEVSTCPLRSGCGELLQAAAIKALLELK